MIMARKLLLFVVVFVCAVAAGEDWPMYKKDAARSGVTAEKIAFPLSKVWRYTPPQPPRPAWPEPGKEMHRIDFDYAPQPVIAGGTVFFGSSADDTLRAVDLVSGRVTWKFTAGGPIRFAPAIADGNMYLACDDGVLYCLDPATGEAKWSFRGARRLSLPS